MLSRGGSVSRDAAQGFLDSAGAFERFEVDALSARWSAVDIDFLKLIEEQVRKAGSHLDVDEVGCGKVGFHLF